jgi:hypothetical protein
VYILQTVYIKDIGRYIDDIIIYVFTTAKQILIDHDNLYKNMKYALEVECDNKINVLDLTQYRKDNNIDLGIFHKPTQTDMTIHYTSRHPEEHKIAAFNYILERIKNLPITVSEQHKEMDRTKHCNK